MRRHVIVIFLIGFVALTCKKANKVNVDGEWLTATSKSIENGLPIVLKLRGHLPPRAEMDNLPWRITFSWEYDGEKNNGMPTSVVNKQMNKLEDFIEKEIEKRGICELAVTRTGDNLKQLIYFVHSEESIQPKLNRFAVELSKFPAKISFKHDPDWLVLAQILDTMIVDEKKSK